MRKERNYLLFILLFVVASMFAQGFVHPGLSHKKSDLDRMKYMLETGQDPWVSTYKLMEESSYASYNYSVQGSASNTELSSFTLFRYDGIAAYYNALMWTLTGDERHAEKCVEIFNAWVNITSVSSTMPLEGGRVIWKMMEGAEIIRHTYTGWSEEDIQKFSDMLVYPGYSTTEEPTAAIASKDVTFYWSMYNGDPARHGNQGLFGYRGIMAMGIFLDNELMYDRALRYLKGEGHRADDLAYAAGPPVLSGRQSSSNEYYDEFLQYSRDNTIEDYGYNEVMSNYIWENGQGQESSRDQAHGLGGVSIITEMCEMAWNQGDDLYGHLDNRPLLGLEFYFRYNLSWDNVYPDQLTPWEPTVESGEFIQRSDRSGRWKSLKINPYTGANLTEDDWNRGRHNLNGIYEMNLGHYKYRMNVDTSETKWLERGFEIMTNTIGVEDDANQVDHPGWGGLKFRRVSPGDPISGFASGLPVFDTPVAPAVLQAENYDHFALNGEGRTYHDVDSINNGAKYRLSDGVDIDTCSEGGYQLVSLEDGEWLTYTIAVPASSLYNISIRYASANANGKIKFSFDGEDKTEEIIVPFGEGYSTGLSDFKDLIIGTDLILSQGVQAMKISISGESNAFVLSSIQIEDGAAHACADGLTAVSASPRITPGIQCAYYEGEWDVLPDFDGLTPVWEGLTDSISLMDDMTSDNFALAFSGYIEIPIDANYTFYTSSAGGCRLTIGGVELINNDTLYTDSVVEHSADICLNEGFHEISVEYFQQTSNEPFVVMYSSQGISQQPLANIYGIGACENLGVTAPDSLVSGVYYAYYTGEWTSLPDFDELTPVDYGHSSSITLNLASAEDYYALTFDGYLNITTEGEYIFYTASDDGSSLWIDGEKIVDNDGTHGVEEVQGTLCLAVGYHKIRVEYFENSAGNSLAVMYEGPDFSKRSISTIYTEPVPARIDEVITFPETFSATVGDADFVPAVTTLSGRVPTYSSTRQDIATIVDGKIHIVSSGTTKISARLTQNGGYTLGYAYQNLIISEPSALDDVTSSQSTIQLFPNPATDELNITMTRATTAHLEILNYMGATVLSQKIEQNDTKLDISYLSSGVYIVNVNIDGHLTTQKFVKE